MPSKKNKLADRLLNEEFKANINAWNERQHRPKRETIKHGKNSITRLEYDIRREKIFNTKQTPKGKSWYFIKAPFRIKARELQLQFVAIALKGKDNPYNHF